MSYQGNVKKNSASLQYDPQKFSRISENSPVSISKHPQPHPAIPSLQPLVLLKKWDSDGKIPAQAWPRFSNKDTMHHASAAAVAMVTATISPRQLGSEGRVDPRGTSGFLQPVSPSHLSCFSHLPQSHQLPPLLRWRWQWVLAPPGHCN